MLKVLCDPIGDCLLALSSPFREIMTVMFMSPLICELIDLEGKVRG